MLPNLLEGRVLPHIEIGAVVAHNFLLYSICGLRGKERPYGMPTRTENTNVFDKTTEAVMY